MMTAVVTFWCAAIATGGFSTVVTDHGKRRYVGIAPVPNKSSVPYFSEHTGYINAVNGNRVTHRGEYFEVVTKPLILTYAQVWWDFVPTFPFPPEIVKRFEGKTMAITGFENAMSRIDNETGEELPVPCSDLYNHHWNLYITSSKAPLSEGERRSEKLRHGGHGIIPGRSSQCWQDDGVAHTLASEITNVVLDTPGDCCDVCIETVGCSVWNYQSVSRSCSLGTASVNRTFRAGIASGGLGRRPIMTPLGTQIPVRQVFSEANGNEHRGSFHGTPEGFAQLLDSPAEAGLLHMSINTRNPDGHNLNPQKGPHPHNVNFNKGIHADGWSGILECPCTDRIDINRTAGTIDGRFDDGCIPGGVLERQNNTICSGKTYNGGMKCCKDQTILLDKSQTQWEDKVDVYFHKLRIYFEEYEPKKIKNAFRLYWQTEEWNGEYDIPQCAPGTPPESCVHTITSTFKAQDLFGGLSSPLDDQRLNCTNFQDVWCGQIQDVEASRGKFQLLNMAFHQHTPAVISGELINADTGELICRNEPLIGTEIGSTYNEKGYAYGIPPCVWGSAQEGLPKPPVLDLNTNLMSIAKYNSSVPHYGCMAMWQGRGGLLD